MAAPPPTFFGLPVDIIVEVTHHLDDDARLWHRHLTTVWVDVGRPQFVPYRFEAWRVEGDFGMMGPVRDFDVPIPEEDDPGLLRPVTYPGEVVDPEPMEELPSPGRLVVDAHVDDDPMDADPDAEYDPYVDYNPEEPDDPEE
ncbi:Mediator of RNA polymerase II transcription subunit 21 [Psidium guajava]|nr:Mediator of RNA polymerase II transcription subunit 21 [Psidium guajava]